MSQPIQIVPHSGQDGHHATYCRICEALCGMIAEVRNGQITKITPDHNNPHSKGHVCIKGVNLNQVVHDQERITTPLKRVGEPGEFVSSSWDEALSDIAKRLNLTLERYGQDSIAMNSGNPPSMGWPSSIGGAMFQQAVGFSRLYSPATEDISTPVLATEIMFGTHSFVFPDLADCEHLLIFGSNPMISHGSLLIAPRIKEDLDAISKRGRVVVIDPRRTQTAKKFEHIAIRPDSDVWLLGAMLKVVFDDGLAQTSFIENWCVQGEQLERAVSWITPERAETECGVAADEIVTLARDFARAPKAAAMGRTGICRGSFSTLTNFFLHALNVVCGKFHAEGGVGWGHGGTATDAQALGIGGAARHGARPSRVSGLPSVWGAQSSLTFLEEILTPGEGQIKALVVVGANPVLSMPNGPQLPAGFAQLDLMVALDLYVTETTQHADYILPVTTQLERDDINLFFMNHMVRPFAQFSKAVIPPIGDARVEFEIFRDIADRMGLAEQFGGATPFEMAEAAIASGVEGAKGLSLEKLKQNPHGLMIASGRWAFDFETRIGHPDKKIHLFDPRIQGEIERLKSTPARPSESLRLINLRKLKSINSWMHNVEKLVRSDEPELFMHPEDAEERTLEDGMQVQLSSKWGCIEVKLKVTDEVSRGTVAYPHGWGHSAGWERANETPGANLNQITPSSPESAEQLSGMSYLEGFDVEVNRL